jgi:hypothetical protein
VKVRGIMHIAAHPSTQPAHPLIPQLLAAHLLRLGGLGGPEARHPAVRVAADLEARTHGGLAVADQALVADLLDLAVEGGEDVVAALGALLQREEDERLPGRVELAGGLLDGGEAGVEGGERGVAEGVGALEVGGGVGEGRGEEGGEGLGERGGQVGGEVEGFGAVGVGLEGGDGVGDERVGEQVLRKC